MSAGGHRLRRLGADGLAGDERRWPPLEPGGALPARPGAAGGFAIPDRVIDSKQPQFLVDIVSESLQPSRYVLTNNVGIAGGLAWELKRSDIIMFDKQGELKYGLDWPDAQGSFVSQAGFADWLAAHRQQGPVSLVLLMDKGESMLDLPLPKPDNAYELGRVVFLQYLPQ